MQKKKKPAFTNLYIVFKSKQKKQKLIYFYIFLYNAAPLKPLEIKPK